MEDYWGDEPDWDDDLSEDEGTGGAATGNRWNVSDAGVPTHYLMLLDCRPDMWKKNNGKSGIATSLSLIQDWISFTMQDSAMYHTGKRNGVGIMFYNTKYRAQKERTYFEELEYQKEPESINKDADEKDEKDAAENSDNDEKAEDEDANDPLRKTTLHELIPMAPPGVSTVKTIRKAMEEEEELRRDYEPDATDGDGDFNGVSTLQVALREGLSMLRNCKTVKTKSTPSSPRRDRIQIWLWTNQDNPPHPGPVKMQLQDMKDGDGPNAGLINIALFGLPNATTGKMFDYSIVYDSLAQQDEDDSDDEDDEDDDDDEEDEEEAAPLLETPLKDKSQDEMNDFSIAQELYKYSKPKRALYKRVPMLLPDWRQHQQQLARQPPETDDKSQAVLATGELPDPRESSAYWLDFYRLIQTSKKPNLVKLDQSTGRKVETLTQLLVSESQDIISSRVANSKDYQVDGNEMSWALRTFVKLGKDRVKMTPQDVKEVKKGSSTNSEFAGLILQGFRPLDDIPELLMIGQSYVVVPTMKCNLIFDPSNKSHIQNHLENQKALASLCQAMREEKVVAVGEFLARTTATSRMLALWPLPKYIFGSTERTGKMSDEEEEEEDDEEEFTWPDTGFLATELPFNDEVRGMRDRPGDDVRTPVSEELEEIATKLVDKLTFKEEDAVIGQSFTNAHLDEYWGFVDQIALNKQVDDKEEAKSYDTIMNPADFEPVQDLISEFASLLPEVETSTTKRAAKRRAEAVPDTSGLDWIKLLREDKLKTCKVPQLKAKLKSFGEPVSGKKADLLERLEEKLLEEYNNNAKGSAVVKEEPL